MTELPTAASRREPSDPFPDPQRTAAMRPPQELLAAAVARGEFAFELGEVARRAFLGASALAVLGLAACASTPKKVARLPDAEWREPPLPPGTVAAAAPTVSTDRAEGAATDPKASLGEDASAAAGGKAGGAKEFNPVGEAALPWAKPRFLWAKAAPDRANLNPMLPVTCVTIHHDGLDELIWSARTADVAARLEHYRVGHLGRGWADIGYHLIIDRGGVLWQGRAVRYQGAHVSKHNEGNIGVLVMGNFDRQKPTPAQLATLRRVVADLRSTYGIKRGRVYTHKEWQDAQTACPGSNLQPRVEQLRRVLKA